MWFEVIVHEAWKIETVETTKMKIRLFFSSTFGFHIVLRSGQNVWRVGIIETPAGVHIDISGWWEFSTRVIHKSCRNCNNNDTKIYRTEELRVKSVRMGWLKIYHYGLGLGFRVYDSSDQRMLCGVLVFSFI